MSVHLNDLAGATKKFAHQFLAMQTVLDALNKIDNLEQAVTQAENNARTATADAAAKIEAETLRDQAEADLSDAQANLAAFEQDASTRVEQLQSEIQAGENKLAAVKSDLAALAQRMAS